MHGKHLKEFTLATFFLCLGSLRYYIEQKIRVSTLICWIDSTLTILAISPTTCFGITNHNLHIHLIIGKHCSLIGASLTKYMHLNHLKSFGNRTEVRTIELLFYLNSLIIWISKYIIVLSLVHGAASFIVVVHNICALFSMIFCWSFWMQIIF